MREVAEAARFKPSDLRYHKGVPSQLDLWDALHSLFTAQPTVLRKLYEIWL